MRRILGVVAAFVAAWCMGWVTGAVAFGAWVAYRFKRGWNR